MPIRVLILAVLAGLALLLAGCATTSKLNPIDEELGLDPEDSPAEIYIRMAEEYYNRGQTDVAFRRALQGLQADDRYPRAHVWVAFLYEEIGDTAKAQTHYQRALALAPRSSDVRFAYGSYLCRQRQFPEADAEFARALDNPLYASPWTAMTQAGQCARGGGDIAKAERYFRDAIAANPSFGPPLVLLAQIELERGDARAAKRYLDRYFAPDTLRTPSIAPTALLVGAQAERQLGNRQRAAEYEKILRANFPQVTEIRSLQESTPR